jgi:hypothetical protein
MIGATEIERRAGELRADLEQANQSTDQARGELAKAAGQGRSQPGRTPRKQAAVEAAARLSGQIAAH